MLCLMCLKHLNDVQFFVRSTLNVYQRFLLVSWSWIAEIYCYSFGNIKHFFFVDLFFLCSSWAVQSFYEGSFS